MIWPLLERQAHDQPLEIAVPIRLRVLGALDLTGVGRDEADAVLAQPTRLALLTYLAMASPRHFRRRDSLLALLWPELDEKHARGALRQALRFIRQTLGAEILESRGADEVGVSHARIVCDAVFFERAVFNNDVGNAAARSLSANP